MANDYISREAAIRAMRGAPSQQIVSDGRTAVYTKAATQRIRACRAANVAPVARASWSRTSSLTNYKCTNCGFRDWYKWRHCPSCGDRMSNTEMEAPNAD